MRRLPAWHLLYFIASVNRRWSWSQITSLSTLRSTRETLASSWWVNSMHSRSILSLMGQKLFLGVWHHSFFWLITESTWKLLPKIFHWDGQNYTLEWIKVGNDMMADTTNGPSNWELVSNTLGWSLINFHWFWFRHIKVVNWYIPMNIGSVLNNIMHGDGYQWINFD